MLDIGKIRAGINTIADEYEIKKVELFGSYAEGTNHEQSDVDLLVEFITSSVSLLTLNALKYRLEELFHTEVDVIHGPLEEDSLITPGKVVPLYESQGRTDNKEDSAGDRNIFRFLLN